MVCISASVKGQVLACEYITEAEYDARIVELEEEFGYDASVGDEAEPCKGEGWVGKLEAGMYTPMSGADNYEVIRETYLHFAIHNLEWASSIDEKYHGLDEDGDYVRYTHCGSYEIAGQLVEVSIDNIKWLHQQIQEGKV